jgi:hypothetical protein
VVVINGEPLVLLLESANGATATLNAKEDLVLIHVDAELALELVTALASLAPEVTAVLRVLVLMELLAGQLLLTGAAPLHQFCHQEFPAAEAAVLR